MNQFNKKLIASFAFLTVAVLILLWGFNEGIDKNSPLAVLGVGFIIASAYRMLNQESGKSIIESIRGMINNTSHSWIGLLAIAISAGGTVWLYSVGVSFTIKMLGLFVFFATLYRCLETEMKS